MTKLADKKIPYKSKQISFIFSANKYPISRNITYRYKVNEGDWVQSNEVVLQSLRPDNYKIILEALNREDMSKSESIFTFSVRPPIWRTAWFILSCITSLSLLLFFLVKLRINSIRIYHEEKTRLSIANSELQLRSLQIQMNPHFLFNALNSIRVFYFE